MSDLTLPKLVPTASTHGIAVGHGRAFEEMNTAIEKGGVKPVIDKVYPLDQAVAAYELLAKGAFGKSVIKIQ